MKIKGQALVLDKKAIVLPRQSSAPVTLTIQAIPLGYEDTMEERIPSPTAPAKDFCRDKKGKYILHEQTGKPIPFRDESDPKYKKSARLASVRQSCLMVFEAMKADENIEWDEETNKAALECNWELVADNVKKELKEANFAMGDLKIIIDEISKLSNLGEDEVKEATESFLSEEKMLD